MTRSRRDNPSSSEEEAASKRRNRRQALALGGAAAAAAAVAALGMNGGKKAQAAPTDHVVIGQTNYGEDQPTGLEGSTRGNFWGKRREDAVFFAHNVADPVGELESAPALTGESEFGVGVIGITRHERPAIMGIAASPGIDPPVGGLGAGSGVGGWSESGIGAEGHSMSGPGGWFHSQSNTGVVGGSESGVGVEGQSTDGWGLLGESKNFGGIVGVTHAVPAPGIPAVGVLGVSDTDKPEGAGVAGTSDGGTGVSGESQSGPGVRGRAPGDAPGVRAISDQLIGPPTPTGDGGLALDVVGKARFSTAGDGVVPAGADAATVSNLAVTPDSHITVSLTGDPGNSAAVVQWVELQGSGFVVHLRVPVSNETPFTYLIVEPGV